MRKFIVIVAMVIACLPLLSQELGTISGVVQNHQTKTPIENVSVTISDNYQESITDLEGNFHFGNIPEGQFTLEISHIGFFKTNQTINLKKGEHKAVTILLKPESKELDEIVIQDESMQDQIISKLPYIETRFVKNQIELEATRDITDYLRSSQNINGIRKGGTQLDPVVRGFKYGQLNVQLNNGQKIEGGCPNRMDPSTAHVEIEDIESIEVKKGPYALKYGPSFGGVINMKTDIPNHNDSTPVHIKYMKSYETNWDGNKDHLNIYGGYKWFFYNFSGGRKEYGNYEDGNSKVVNSEFSKYNYKGQVGFIPFKNHTISLNYEESKGRDIRFPTLPMDERKDDTRLLSADYSAVGISEVFETLKFKVYNSDVRHEMDNKNRPFSDTVVAVSIIDAVNTGGRIETGFRVKSGLLTAGVDYENIQKDGERIKNMIKQPNLPVKKEKLWNNALINNTGIFLEYFYELQDWEFIGAARLDINNADSDSILIMHPVLGEIYNYGKDSIKSEFTNFSFSLGVNRKINESWSLSLAIGRGVRSPDMTERFIILLPIGYDKFDYLGDPGLKPEANNQIDLTVKYNSRKFGQMQLNGFYSLVNNYITGKRLPPSVQKPLTKDVLGVKQFYNAGNARMRGFEFSYASPASHKFGGSFFAAYTYGTIDEVNQYVTNDEGAVVDDQLLYDDALTEIPPFEATATIHYKFFNSKLIPEFKFRMVSSQNHVSEASYEPSTPGFVVSGFSIMYQHTRYFKVSAGVNNLFDVAYYEHLNRNIIGSTYNLYEPGRSFYINLFFNI